MDSLENITNYVINHSEEADTPVEPVEHNFVLNDDGSIDVIFKDGKKLSEFLPPELEIKDTPGFNKPVLNKVFSEDGKIQNMEVQINYEWLKKGGSEQIAIFAHEIGHALAIEEEIKHNKELKELIENHPSFDVIDNNVKVYMTYCFLKSASNSLDVEIQAWNYGKIIASLLGIDDIQYEDIMRPQIEGVYYHIYSQAYDFIKGLYIKDIFNENPTFLNSDITYPLYDLAQQSEVQVTAEKLLEELKKLDPEKYKRNAKETGNFQS